MVQIDPGLVFALAVTPLGCVLLTWIYSKQMERGRRIIAAQEADLRARGWMPVGSLAAGAIPNVSDTFISASGLRWAGKVVNQTVYGRAGWLTCEYAIEDTSVDSMPSDAHGIVLLRCPWPMTPGPDAWCTVSHGVGQPLRRPRTSGLTPAVADDLVHLLSSSPFLPGMMITRGWLFVWARINRRPEEQWYLTADLDRDLVALATALYRRLNGGARTT